MLDALMESAAVAVMFSAGLFVLAGVAALADLLIGRPETRRPDRVEPGPMYRQMLGDLFFDGEVSRLYQADMPRAVAAVRRIDERLKEGQ